MGGRGPERVKVGVRWKREGKGGRLEWKLFWESRYLQAFKNGHYLAMQMSSILVIGT